jgi:hypothetical protein
LSIFVSNCRFIEFISQFQIEQPQVVVILQTPSSISINISGTSYEKSSFYYLVFTTEVENESQVIVINIVFSTVKT